MHPVHPRPTRPAATRRRLAGAVALVVTATLASACGGGDGGGAAATAATAAAPSGASGPDAPVLGGAPAAGTAPSSSVAPAPDGAAAPDVLPTSAAPRPRPTGTTTSGAGAPCPTVSLGATLGGQRDDAAGTSGYYFYLYLTNTGRTTCTLNGHPGLSYVAGEDGHQVGRAADREEAGPPVSLVPGAMAHVRVRVRLGDVDKGDCQPVPVRGLRVYPPDQTTALFIAQDGTACGTTGFSLLRVGPVVAGRPSGPGAL